MFCSEECMNDFHEGPFLDRVDQAVSKAQILMDKQLEAERARMRKDLDKAKALLKEEKDLLYEAMCPADKRRFIEWMQKRKKA
jgi:hypothetical protein